MSALALVIADLNQVMHKDFRLPMDRELLASVAQTLRNAGQPELARRLDEAVSVADFTVPGSDSITPPLSGVRCLESRLTG